MKHDGEFKERPFQERLHGKFTYYAIIARIGDLDRDIRINRRAIRKISQTGFIWIEHANFVGILKTNGRGTNFDGCGIFSADKNLYLIFVFPRLFIQFLQNQNRILRTNDIYHVLLDKLIIRINVMLGVRIGIGTKIPVNQGSR